MIMTMPVTSARKASKDVLCPKVRWDAVCLGTNSDIILARRTP
jgi:hypothetical protein